jgi:hypothetical protein
MMWSETKMSNSAEFDEVSRDGESRERERGASEEGRQGGRAGQLGFGLGTLNGKKKASAPSNMPPCSTPLLFSATEMRVLARKPESQMRKVKSKRVRPRRVAVRRREED